MKLQLLIALAALATLVACDEGYYGYAYYGPPGLKPVAGGYAAPYNNADRQRVVNHIAAKVGAGVGTAFKDDVPGTGNVFPGYGYGYYGRPWGYDGYNGYGFPRGGYY